MVFIVTACSETLLDLVLDETTGEVTTRELMSTDDAEVSGEACRPVAPSNCFWFDGDSIVRELSPGGETETVWSFGSSNGTPEGTDMLYDGADNLYATFEARGWGNPTLVIRSADGTWSPKFSDVRQITFLSLIVVMTTIGLVLACLSRSAAAVAVTFAATLLAAVALGPIGSAISVISFVAGLVATSRIQSTSWRHLALVVVTTALVLIPVIWWKYTLDATDRVIYAWLFIAITGAAIGWTFAPEEAVIANRRRSGSAINAG